jgi:hypothetical protein
VSLWVSPTRPYSFLAEVTEIPLPGSRFWEARMECKTVVFFQETLSHKCFQKGRKSNLCFITSLGVSTITSRKVREIFCKKHFKMTHLNFKKSKTLKVMLPSAVKEEGGISALSLPVRILSQWHCVSGG